MLSFRSCASMMGGAFFSCFLQLGAIQGDKEILKNMCRLF